MQRRRPRFDSWFGKILWRRDRLPTPIFLGFPYGSAGIESAHNPRDLGSIPGLGRSPGEGKGCPLQYSGLENSMDCIVHGITKSWTRLSDFKCKCKHILIFSDLRSNVIGLPSLVKILTAWIISLVRIFLIYEREKWYYTFFFLLWKLKGGSKLFIKGLLLHIINAWLML